MYEDVSSLTLRVVSLSKRGMGMLALLICIALVFALAFFVMPLLARIAYEGFTDLSARVTQTGSDADARLLAQFNAANWSDNHPPLLSQMAAGIKRSRALQEQVLNSFWDAKDNVQRGHFSYLLRSAPMPNLPSMARQWAVNPESIKARMNGFSFLSGERYSPEIGKLFVDALHNENDPQVLGRVVWGMKRDNVPDPQVSRKVIARLHELTRHESSEVRQGSIQRIAEWDKGFVFLEQDVLRLMADSEVDVRIAAIGATSLTMLTSNNIKSNLILILENPKESLSVRSAASLNLGRYHFTEEENLKVVKALAELGPVRKIVVGQKMVY